MKIAFCGPFYSGKTATADFIVNKYKGYKIDYTGLLKSMAVQALNQVNLTNDLTIKKINSEKKKYRSFLQELGAVLDFDGGFGVDGLIKKWQWEGSIEPAVFDNVRFYPQWAILKKYDFKLVNLFCNVDEIANRALKSGVANEDLHKWIQHPAEKGIDRDEYDLSIDTTNKPVEDVVQEINNEFLTTDELLNFIIKAERGD